MKSLLVLLLLPSLAFAGEVAGVKLPDAAQVGEKNLVLNGMGLRKKFLFKVYVAGLYLENKQADASKVITADETKRVHMKILRDLDKKTMGEAIESGFNANNKANMPKLRERLDKLLKGMVDLKERDDVVITYAPGKGTSLSIKGREGAVIEGKDFADAMFSVWLGASPADPELKNGMLGKN